MWSATDTGIGLTLCFGERLWRVLGYGLFGFDLQTVEQFLLGGTIG